MTSDESRKRSYSVRLGRLASAIRESGLDGIVLVPGPNLRYYTGVNSLLLERPFLFLLPKEGQSHLLAPKLESGPYRRGPIQMMIHDWTDSEGPSRTFEELTQHVSIKGKWGLEGRVPFRFVHILLKYAHPDLEDAEPLLGRIRETKDPEEMRYLQQAALILCRSLLRFPNMIRPGMTELQLARELMEEIYSNGAEHVDEVLIQSGRMAADPHHLPSTRKLRRKESIVVDATCQFAGYYADITRTFILGRDENFDSIYLSVLEAQEAALSTSKAGETVGAVDYAARSRLEQNQLGEFFIHRTGHGLGLEVHELPYIVQDGRELLEPRMVFTVEPSVYFPTKMGVRIEDDVLVTDSGRKVLTRSLPKGLGWWR